MPLMQCHGMSLMQCNKMPLIQCQCMSCFCYSILLLISTIIISTTQNWHMYDTILTISDI
jgi:hypothetical protein